MPSSVGVVSARSGEAGKHARVGVARPWAAEAKEMTAGMDMLKPLQGRGPIWHAWCLTVLSAQAAEKVKRNKHPRRSTRRGVGVLGNVWLLWSGTRGRVHVAIWGLINGSEVAKRADMIGPEVAPCAGG
jgi:hypothetical protein